MHQAGLLAGWPDGPFAPSASGGEDCQLAWVLAPERPFEKAALSPSAMPKRDNRSAGVDEWERVFELEESIMLMKHPNSAFCPSHRLLEPFLVRFLPEFCRTRFRRTYHAVSDVSKLAR